MIFDEPYGSDHVGLNSPTLKPIMPNLDPIFDGIEIYCSEVCAINEVGFSLQWRGVNHYSNHEWDDYSDHEWDHYSDHEWEPSQNDAILIYLLSGGTAVDVARTAATEPLASDYDLEEELPSSNRPYYCPVSGYYRIEGGKGIKRKTEMIRHGWQHESVGYVCPYCVDHQHNYPRPDNLQR